MVTAFWDSLEMERISRCRPVDAEINIQFKGRERAPGCLLHQESFR